MEVATLGNTSIKTEEVKAIFERIARITGEMDNNGYVNCAVIVDMINRVTHDVKMHAVNSQIGVLMMELV